MAKVIDDDRLLRGLTEIARDGLDGAISAHALHNMIHRGHIKLGKVAGKYTSTRRRIRQMFDAMMDGGV